MQWVIQQQPSWVREHPLCLNPQNKPRMKGQTVSRVDLCFSTAGIGSSRGRRSSSPDFLLVATSPDMRLLPGGNGGRPRLECVLIPSSIFEEASQGLCEGSLVSLKYAIK